MKKRLTLTILFFFITILSHSQSHIGNWSGILGFGDAKLNVVFNFVDSKKSDKKSTMDSPSQGAKGIVIDDITISNNKNLYLTIKSLGVEFKGEIREDMIIGIFNQNGISLPLTLKRIGKNVNTSGNLGVETKGNNLEKYSEKVSESTKLERTQIVKPPFNYLSENVVFGSKSTRVRLAGTLTKPNDRATTQVVILISGSGPQNRNCEILGHKPFLVIADYLSSRGVAVLRYDDRGTGKSIGVFRGSTTADFAKDAEGALEYIKGREEFENLPIGLIGHSEGGSIAFKVGAKSDDVDFLVSLAGPGLRGDSLSLLQTAAIAKSMGMSESDMANARGINKKIYNFIIESKTSAEASLRFDTFAKESLSTLGATAIERIKRQTLNSWLIYFMSYDPTDDLKSIKVPLLALNGSKDLQVLPKENLSAIERAVKSGGNMQVICTELPNLNHLFQNCETGSVDEYATIKETFSPDALNLMYKWILDMKRK